MAEPQGIDVPMVITTAIVTTILTGVTIEGVRAYYQVYEAQETAAKWEMHHDRNVEQLKTEQSGLLKSSSIPIDDAMKRVIAAGGKATK